LEKGPLFGREVRAVGNKLTQNRPSFGGASRPGIEEKESPGYTPGYPSKKRSTFWEERLNRTAES